MAAIAANGITIEVERHGPTNAEPILLIRGLGSQLIHWPEALISGLVAAGFHVVTFDNRDSGLSQKFADAPAYSLSDMVDDCAGVLDALGFEAAHAMGISMGGMILQIMALRHPQRLLSATIVMSSSGAPDLPPADPEAQALLTAEPPSHRREDVIAHELRAGRVWGSPRWSFDEATRADLIGRAFDRCYDPGGTARQHAAILAAGRDLSNIEAIVTPALVIHGSDDRLLPPAHGRDIAARIAGARFIEIAGMGHDIEGGCPAILVRKIAEFAHDATQPGPKPKN